MSQTSRHIQEQTLEQKQGFSQFQFQLTRLLELPIEGLEERVRTEVMENPALEELDEDEISMASVSDFSEEGGDVTDDNMIGEEDVDESPDTYTTDVDEQYLEALGDYRTLEDIPDYALADRNNSEEVKSVEIPFEVVKSDLVKSIDQLVFDKKVDGIIEVRDETDKEGLGFLSL